MRIHSDSARIHQPTVYQNRPQGGIVQAGDFDGVLAGIRPVNSSRHPIDGDAFRGHDVGVDEGFFVRSVVFGGEERLGGDVAPVNATLSAILVNADRPGRCQDEETIFNPISRPNLHARCGNWRSAFASAQRNLHSCNSLRDDQET